VFRKEAKSESFKEEEVMFKFSAADIANQSFQTRFRGYDVDQVHEFLDGLAREWREVQTSYRALKEEMDKSSKELREYRRRETSLAQALEVAREVADEIRHQADRDSELILADTELKAERMLAAAEQEVEQLRAELNELQTRRADFHDQIRQSLDQYGALLEEYEAQTEAAQGHPLPPIPGSSRTSSAQQEDDEEGGDQVAEDTGVSATT